ncbi:hypothetical protein ACI782_14410 [Geodermatophilus sp. SYSU D00703]
MSWTSGGRAAVFTQQSQSVDVSVEGAWWPGSILGWRHDPQGPCEVWVRVAVAGVVREIWTALTDLRLPEPPLAVVAPAAAGRGDGAGSLPVDLRRAAARERLVAGVLGAPEVRQSDASAPVRHRRRHGGDVTAEMPAIGVGFPGRHRAPAVAGRHRAADDDTRVDLQAVAVPPRLEVDCLTRPMRLGDRVPRPRSPRVDGVVRA